MSLPIFTTLLTRFQTHESCSMLAMLIWLAIFSAAKCLLRLWDFRSWKTTQNGPTQLLIKLVKLEDGTRNSTDSPGLQSKALVTWFQPTSPFKRTTCFKRSWMENYK